mmetsp:Transcript_38493/g.82127  ORF Transcript_38493/g.82127 Transcript_38493/m.82127 type:complete len:166 (-) Transcript_38493:390-887(-)
MRSNSNSDSMVAFIIAVVASFLLMLSSEVDAHSVCEKHHYLSLNRAFVHTFNTQPGVSSPGDTWTWHSKLMDTDTRTTVGEVAGTCISVPAGFWKCDETLIFPEGHIFVHYVHEPSSATSTGGITGGTWKYMQATGQIDVTEPAKRDDPWEVSLDVCLPVDRDEL